MKAPVCTIWACANQKGGVGKTCMTVHLAHARARAGERVLVVDMDPQATASAVTETEPDDDTAGLWEALTEVVPLADVIRHSPAWGVDVAPATLQMARLEQVTTPGVEFSLAEALGPVLSQYDRVLIDCPPSLGRLMATGLVAASHALIVTEPSGPALRGMSDLLDTIAVVRRRYRQHLQLAGVLVNRVVGTREATLRLRELEEAFPDEIWSPTVHARAAIAEALGAHEPVTSYHGEGARAAAAAIAALADVMAARSGRPETASQVAGSPAVQPSR